MKALLDSHVFLWALNNPELLGPKTTALLIGDNTRVFVSAASIWELGLKHKKKKLPYSTEELLDGLAALNAELLELNASHLRRFDAIDLPHKDPFDTLLVAQSQAEDCIFVTDDRHILASAYANVRAASV